MVIHYHHGQEHLPGPALQRGHQSFVLLSLVILISDIILLQSNLSFNHSSSLGGVSSISWASPIRHQQFQHTRCTGSRISSRLHLSQLPCTSSISYNSRVNFGIGKLVTPPLGLVPVGSGANPPVNTISAPAANAGPRIGP